MTRTYNIHEAKTHLSRLVEWAVEGDEIVIAKAGKPLVKIVPFEAPKTREPRRRGFLAGQIKVPADFDTMFAKEIETMFYGKDEAPS